MKKKKKVIRKKKITKKEKFETRKNNVFSGSGAT